MLRRVDKTFSVGRERGKIFGSGLVGQLRVYPVNAAKSSRFRQTEIGNFYLADGSHHYVLRLDVAVNDSRAVRGEKRSENLNDKIQNFFHL